MRSSARTASHGISSPTPGEVARTPLSVLPFTPLHSPLTPHLNQGTIRHYLFKPLSLTDDADLACEDERVVKSIGTIQLRICRIDVTGEVAPAVPEFVSAEPPTLHEMSKKARVSHQAG